MVDETSKSKRWQRIRMKWIKIKQHEGGIMYSYIKGILEEIEEGQVVVENHGIGYCILTPSNIEESLPPKGEEVKLYTYLHIKEDAHTLIGFLTKESLHMFRLLLGVNGIGPKGALGILSVMDTDELRLAIVEGDAKAIARAPGVGAKTAQRVVLELKDKTDAADLSGRASKQERRALQTAAQNDALQALIALGYSFQDASSAIAKAERTEEMDVEEILKAALKQMALI